MSILSVDIGNTQIKFSVFSNKGKFKRYFTFGTDLKNLEKNIKKLKVKDKFEICLVSSVVPSKNKMIVRLVKKLFDVKCEFFDKTKKAPIKMMFPNKSEVGVDRFLASCGASMLYPKKNLVVIGLGTAITIDCVKNGRYLGGLTIPGLYTSAKTLFKTAELLPDLDLKNPPSKFAFPKNTKESLEIGIFYGFADMVCGLINRFKKKLGKNTKVVATGGFANSIAKICKDIDDVQPHLITTALTKIYLNNKKECEK